MAQQAYASGDYETARLEFAALLADPGASPDEQRLALHWRGRSELNLGDSAAAIATLQMFLTQYPNDALALAAQFNLGQAYEQAGRYDEAIAAYLGAIRPGEPVNVYIYERIGDIRLQTGAYTDTITAYENGINATDDASFKVHLREGIAEAELLRGNMGAAIAQYEAILSTSQIDAYRAKLLRLMGDAYKATGNLEAAHEQYLKAVNQYPEAYDSYLALVELVVNANVLVDEFQRGLVNYHAASYQPAIAAFERYLAQVAAASPVSVTTSLTATEAASDTIASAAPAPTPANKADEAIWLMGLSQQAFGQYNNAIASFQRLIGEYPNSSHWGQAHLEKGETLLYQGNHAEAKAVWRAFAEQRPDHPLASETLWQAARLDLSDDLFEEARTHFHHLVQIYPTSDHAAEALYWAGQAAYKLEDYEGAIEDWAALAQKYPSSELISFAGYWQAKTLLELGRGDEARAILTQTAEGSPDYYRLRARDLLAGRQPETVPVELPDESELSAEKAEAETWLRQWLGLPETEAVSALSAQIQNDTAFQRGDALLELGLRDKALVEFEGVKDRWWNDALAMYQLSVYFWEKGLGRLSILSAARLIFLSPVTNPEEAPLFIQRLYYPIYFGELIFSQAERFDLDPILMVALIRQESLFELSAHSHAGARGLMQVMPATGEYVAQHVDFGGFNSDQLWLPYVSIQFGAWYLDQQLGLFDDNQFAALAAYNAGPANVLEWIKVSEDLDIFVESIPFWESRIYIRRIYENLAAYRRLYGPPLADQP
jgi:soluble lytic murein transglycosylase